MPLSALRPARAGSGIAAALLLGASLAASLPAQGRGLPVAKAERAAAQPATTLVILVRHAEKAAVPGNDPPLSEPGTARAQALRAALADAGVQAVLVTPLRRTLDTARPLLESTGLTPETVPIGGADHVRQVAEAVRRQAGRVVLVVGHSNTIPAIVGALGGPRLPDLCDANYATMFVLALPADGPTRLVRTRYGAAEPAGADQCATPGMTR